MTVLLTALCFLAGGGVAGAEKPADRTSLQIGWAATDITPARSAVLGGMPWARISTEIKDPLTATALAFEECDPGEPREKAILISCDLRSITNEVRDGVREALRQILPEVDPMRVVLNATHTHNAPPLGDFGVKLNAMVEEEYRAFVIPRLAAVAAQAWRNRAPGGISFGLAHATIGHNRLISSHDGKSAMGGSVKSRNFSHVEGYEDTAVQLLYTWNRAGDLTGVVVNVAVTSQVSQHLTVISADYWHDTREELRRRLGNGLFVLPQCSAAGDQLSRPHIYARAEERMERLSGRDRRGQIAVRLADAVTSILPQMRDNIEWQPLLHHRVKILQLPRRQLGAADVEKAVADALPHRQQYEKLLAELEADPKLLEKPDFLRKITSSYWHTRRGQAVEERFRLQETEPRFPAEVHALRLGDLAMVTNPFELYLDFGMQIKGRSRTVQTFVVELAGGSAGYLPTARSVAGGAYGAVPASTHVGPDGGRELVDQTLQMIDDCWKMRSKDILGSLKWPEEWCVFVPSALRTPDPTPEQLQAIPETMTVNGEVLAPRTVKAEAGKVDFAPIFGRTEEGRTAYVYLSLDSPEAQEANLGFGADWWLQAWVNGELVKDTNPKGNGSWPPSISDHIARVRLRQGKNILVIRFVSGSGGSVLAVAGPEQLRRALNIAF